MRCHKHRGMPEAGPRKATARKGQRPAAGGQRASPMPARRPPSRSPRPRRRQPTAQERRRRERVEVAARFCADTLSESWQETVAGRATDYVTDETWQRLFRSSRRRRCKFLAELASAVLAGKKGMHDLVGWAASGLASLFGADRVARTFVRELASRIPLPPDAKLVATARGIQVTGILLCVVNGDDLTRCHCFIDLASNEAKTRVKKILEAAMTDWTELATFPGKGR